MGFLYKRLPVRYCISALVLFLLLSGSFAASLVMKRFTKGFHLARLDIYRDCLYQESMDRYVDFAEESLAIRILSQPFTYLHRGAQCYVFVSQDQEYVIKIFQKNRQATLFTQWKEPHKREKKIDFTPCLTAYYQAKKETALIYMHLAPTENRLPRLLVTSPTGQKFYLPLDRYAFVIQKKVKLFHEALLEASKKGELEIYLASFFSLLNERLLKGIRNEDISLISNYGFLGQQAIELDFGRYRQSVYFLEPHFQELEKNLFVGELRKFMQTYLPEDLHLLENI